MNGVAYCKLLNGVSYCEMPSYLIEQCSVSWDGMFLFNLIIFTAIFYIWAFMDVLWLIYFSSHHITNDPNPSSKFCQNLWHENTNWMRPLRWSACSTSILTTQVWIPQKSTFLSVKCLKRMRSKLKWGRVWPHLKRLY